MAAWLAHGLTDVGRQRPANEDAILVAPPLLVVCDGLGGHAAGEVAATLAVETIAAALGPPGAPGGPPPGPAGSVADRLRLAIHRANQAILRRAESDPSCRGMGTTVATAIVPAGSATLTYAHVGDSRIYRIRGGGRPAITPLTRDDSWGDAGPAYQHVLTKALGLAPRLDFEVREQALEPADTLLLCSDGLTTMVPDARILELVTTGTADLRAACRDLVDEANARGGRDNVSVILARLRA